MHISDWSSDVCSSDLAGPGGDIVSHITLGSDDLGRSGAFYEGLLAPLGLVRLPTEESDNVDHAFGHARCAIPVVFPQMTFDGRPSVPGHSSVERRGRKECVRTCRSCWFPFY